MTATVFNSTADGVIAALLAPFFMSIGFFIWDVRWTSSKGSAFALNMYKCNVASIWFVIMAAVRGFSQSVDSSTGEDIDPLDVFTVTAVGFLMLSSTLGIVVGDVLWLEALRLLGAKHVIVVDSLKPFISAFLGRLALGEILKPPTYGGMMLTVLGVGLVAWEEQRRVSSREIDDGIEDTIQVTTTEKEMNKSIGDDCDILLEMNGKATEGVADGEDQLINETTNDTAKQCVTKETKQVSMAMKQYKRGYACAFMNVAADSLGSLITKQYGVEMTTWSINLIRFGFAGVILLFMSIGMRIHRRYRSNSHHESDKATKIGTDAKDDSVVNGNNNATKDEPTTKVQQSTPLWFELPTLTPRGWLQITLGVAFVTFLCPALEKFALFQIALGLTVSLSSIGPLYGLLLDWPFKGKVPTLYGCVGVLLTIGGVVVLCLCGA
jgi:drug/metabolite transporter (DMT)-like permease